MSPSLEAEVQPLGHSGGALRASVRGGDYLKWPVREWGGEEREGRNIRRNHVSAGKAAQSQVDARLTGLRRNISFDLLLSSRVRGPPRWPSGKASASRAEDPGFESRLPRDFFGVESYQ